MEAARAHIVLFTFNNFAEYINKNPNTAVKAVLGKLCVLYAVNKILERPIGLLESEHLAPNHFDLLKEVKNKMLSSIRNEACALVDAF